MTERRLVSVVSTSPSLAEESLPIMEEIATRELESVRAHCGSSACEATIDRTVQRITEAPGFLQVNAIGVICAAQCADCPEGTRTEL